MTKTVRTAAVEPFQFFTVAHESMGNESFYLHFVASQARLGQ
jgi:hypothetical protein